MQLTKVRVFLMLILVVTSSSLLVWKFTSATPAPSRNTTCEPGNCSTVPCTYDNYIDGAAFMQKDCKTGIGTSYTSAYNLWTGEIANNQKDFFEAGTWDFCAAGGAGATITGSPASAIEIWGVYNQTIFKCSAAAGSALTIGNQNAVDSVYHAQGIYIHDITLDGGGPTVTNGRGLSITTAYDVHIDHIIIQHSFEMATGGLAVTNWNNQQIKSQFIFIANSLFLACKVTVSGMSNGNIEFSSFAGMPSNPSHRATIDFSKGDLTPVISNLLTNFDFDHNTVTGWTDCTGGFMAGFEANTNDTISNNYIDTCIGLTTVGVTGPLCSAVIVSNNLFVKGTGTIHFTYCNNVEVTGNQWLTDSTPANGAVGLQVDGGACGGGGENACPTDFLIHHNQIIKWGGPGMVLNMTRGLVDSNDIYDVNQGNANANSNPGIQIDKGLLNVHINDNEIVSDTASGAGTSRPIYYLGAGKNLTITTNYFFYENCGNGPACAIFFNVAADPTVTIQNDFGYNPIGAVTNFIVGTSIGVCGTGNSITSTTEYTVCGTDITLTCTGGTVTNITEEDPSDNTVFSVANCAALPATGIYLPRGYGISWTETGAPTINVYGN